MTPIASAYTGGDALFRGLLESAPDAMVIINKAGTIVLVNSQTERLFGYPCGELLGQPVDVLVPRRFRRRHQDHRRRYFAAPWRVREMGAGVALYGLRRNGEEFPVEIRLSQFEAGNETLVSSSIRDVTDRIQSNRASQQLAAIVESSDDAILSKSLEGVITSWNRAAERLFGYSAPEAIGQSITLIVPPDRHGEEDLVLARIRAGESVEMETMRQHKDGTSVAIALMVSPIKDAEGRIVGASKIARDITERKRAEEALRASEEHYHAFMEQASDGILVFDRAGRSIDVNAAACALAGYTRDELLQRGISEMIAPEDIAATPLHLEELYAGKIVRSERDVVRKDGTRVPVEISARMLDDGRLHAIVRDITERKRTEEDIRAVSRFPGENPNPVLRIARDGTLLYINKAGLNLLPQWHLEVGRPSPPILRKVVSQSVDNGSPHELDLQHGERVYTFFVAPIVAARYANLYGLDITERKRAEEARRASEERYRALFEYAPDGIVSADAEGTYLDANASMCRMLGYTRDELIGLHASDIVAPTEIPKIGPALRTINAKSAYYREWQLRRKDGSVFSAEAIATMMPDGNLLGIIRDITERQQRAGVLRQANERLQDLSRKLLDIQETERRHLARELHDEIGQALTATKINLQSLQHFPDPTAVASRLDESVGIVERALQQVRSLSLELRPALLDDLGLGAALRWLLDEHARRAGLHSEFHAGSPDRRFDPAVEIACFRIAQEALNNIVKHAGAGSITVDVQTKNGALHLRVRDDGVGFDVAAARRRATRGASLGLLSMEERAGLAEGGIEWRSTLGQGTEVHAWFAVHQPADAHRESTGRT